MNLINNKIEIVIGLFYIVLLFLLINPIYGSGIGLEFHDPKLQLSDNGIRAIAEDKKGFMWFGSESGLNQYDGVKIHVYNHLSGDCTSLSSSSIYSILIASNGAMWVGTNFGLNLFNRTSNTFTQFYYPNEEKASSHKNFIIDITEDREGDIWLVTHGGICYVDQVNHRIVSFSNFKGSTDIKYEMNLSSMVELDDGRVIAGCSKGYLIELDKVTRSVVYHYFDNGEANQRKNLNIEKLNLVNGSLWAGSKKHGLIKINKIQGGHIYYTQYVHNPKDVHSVSNNFVTAVCAVNDNVLLVGTENGGLNVFDIRRQKFKSYNKGRNGNGSIGGNSIWSLYKDSRGLVWVGIFNVGINVIDSIPQKFKSYENNFFNENSLTHSAITAFVEDGKGNLWITSDGGGVDYWNRETDSFHHFKHIVGKPNSLSSNACLCLYLSKKDELWVGSFSGGISILNSDGKSFRHISTKDGLSSNNIFSIAERTNGKIYIASHNGGLDEYNPETGKIKPLLKNDPISESSPTIYMNNLFVDRNDNLWIGFNDAGIKIMQEGDNGSYEFETLKYDPFSDKGLSNNIVLVINEDAEGNIWIGTRDGLNKYNPKSKVIEVFRKTDGLPSNTIVGILMDKNHNLWISTLNGLSMFDPQTKQFKNYNESDGIQGLKFTNRAASYKNKKGELFFGGNEGFTYFDPSEIQYDNSFQRVYLNDLKIFNEPVSVGDKGSPLIKHISETDTIIFSYKQSVFTLDYAALNFTKSEKINYAYWMEGLDKGWNYVGNKRSATYTNLDAGDYTFHIKSTNVEGEWNTEETIVFIIVLPPWWEMAWFRVLVALLIILFLYLFYLNRLASIKLQKKQLEFMVAERTRELFESNTQLEEINQEVVQQKEELVSQTDALADANTLLEDNTKELELHKNNLEDLVQYRTAELEDSKRKAEESERLKTAFLANISHEIRTPMNAIVGFSNLLKQKNLDDFLKGKYINQISSNTNSLLSLIDDILDLSMMETTDLRIKKKEFPLNELLEEVFSDGIGVGKAVDLKLTNTVEHKHYSLKSDRYRIKQVLLNLFGNALKFTEEGLVELGCTIKEGKLEIFVRDTGIGISEENLETIFNRFRKISDDNTKLFRGAGLGLAISKKIAEFLDAKLSVQSDFGKGSTFILTFPLEILHKEPSVNKIKLEEETYDWSDKQILVVDDEETNFFYLESVLSQTNAKVSWARDGKVAVDLFEEGQVYDIVLMDLKMPIMNGYDASEAIRKLVPQQCIIAQTAHIRLKADVQMEKYGFKGFIVKPILPDLLIEILAKHLVL